MDVCIVYKCWNTIELMCLSKTNDLCDSIICHYGYFLEINVKFQPKVCDICHDLIQKPTGFTDIAILSVKGNE